MMRRLRRGWARFAALFVSARLEDELEQEIAAHLAFLEDEFRNKGLPPEEARRASRRAYGGVEQAKQRHRNERAYQGLAQISQDLRYALRQLFRAPGFMIAAISTLALGIGANTAIFSVVNAVLLEPLSYPDPGRIVEFMLMFPQGPTPGASVPDFHLWRDQSRAFQDVSAYEFGTQVLNLTGGAPEQIHGLRVTRDYFHLFGARMVMGRSFTAKEDSLNAGNFAVLSYNLWKRKFGGDTSIVGKPIVLGNMPFTVVGVTAQAWRTDPAADVWLPFQFDLNSTDQTHYFKVAGRLKPGITLAQANAQLKLAASEAKRSYPLADPQLGFSVQPLHDAVVADVRSSLLVLEGAVSFVLLIACANVANLFLTRATARKREFAIRAALGASRRRILYQLLTESILLSSMGGLLGLGLGMAGVRALLAVSPGDIPRIGENNVSPDWRILIFTLGLSLFTGILFGVFPAWSASRPDLNGELKENGSRQGGGFGQNKARSLLVISELSLAIVLLIGAALLLRTFIALRQIRPGFDPHNVLTMDMSLVGTNFNKTESVSRLLREGRERLNALPGVEASAATCWPPLKGRMGLPFDVIDRHSAGGPATGDAIWMDASPGYFDVLRIPVLRGRAFTDRDDATAPHVAVINETMAKRYWPNQDPLGQRIIIGKQMGPKFQEPAREIIGVVGDTRDYLTPAPEPTVIVPQAQATDGMTKFSLQFGPVTWLMRTHVAPQQMAAIASEQLRQASGGLAVGSIRTMDELVLHSSAPQRFNMLLLAIFAGCAMVLSALGIYGVMAYSITQRTQEIGIRMALGADRTDIRNWVLRQGMLLAILGVLGGVGAALVLTRFLGSFLYGVETWDPMVFFLVPVLLASVAMVAVWAPARRAARLSPISALRLG